MAKEERFDWDYELSKSRVVLLTGEIGEDTVHQVCTKLTILDDKNITDINAKTEIISS